jgi:hypothetical protein
MMVRLDSNYQQTALGRASPFGIGIGFDTYAVTYAIRKNNHVQVKLLASRMRAELKLKM